MGLGGRQDAVLSSHASEGSGKGDEGRRTLRLRALSGDGFLDLDSVERNNW